MSSYEVNPDLRGDAERSAVVEEDAALRREMEREWAAEAEADCPGAWHFQRDQPADACPECGAEVPIRG